MTPAFVAQLSQLGESFVEEAFGVLHRAHASTVGLPKRLPSCVGFLVEREVRELSRLRDQAERPSHGAPRRCEGRGQAPPPRELPWSRGHPAHRRRSRLPVPPRPRGPAGRLSEGGGHGGGGNRVPGIGEIRGHRSDCSRRTWSCWRRMAPSRRRWPSTRSQRTRWSSILAPRPTTVRGGARPFPDRFLERPARKGRGRSVRRGDPCRIGRARPRPRLPCIRRR